MAAQTLKTSITAEQAQKGSMLSLLIDNFTGAGFDSEECEPMSDGYFKVLMALVVVATFAFGCIVNGWLL